MFEFFNRRKKPDILIGKTFVKNDDVKAHQAYVAGVACLSNKAFYKANEYFKQASTGEHASAFYNLALLNGGGLISPYDLDFAAECFYKAASAGHHNAAKSLYLLEAADRAGLGTTNLASLAKVSGVGLNSMVMTAGCRFYGALCKNYGAAKEVIDYELDAAASSDQEFVHRFISRAGVPESRFKGGLGRIVTGTAADQITAGINSLFFGMKQAGNSDEICIMARCTIVGYVASKSTYAERSKPLLGLDKFFI